MTRSPSRRSSCRLRRQFGIDVIDAGRHGMAAQRQRLRQVGKDCEMAEGIDPHRDDGALH